MILILLIGVLLISYANGANDNFKGVATLYGSHTASYRRALGWATLTTLLGSLLAAVFARELVKTFSGNGLVPEGLAGQPAFLAAVGIGAGGVVLLAAWRGLPVSTTHALLGGLLGAGLVKAGLQINTGLLLRTFLIPLLVSPVLALALTAPLYRILSTLRRRLRITKDLCVCVGEESEPVFVPISPALGVGESAGSGAVSLAVDRSERCVERYGGRMFGVQVGSAIDVLHYASAGAVSFARGLNDTPKIAGLLLLVPVLGRSGWGVFLVAMAMAAGGLLAARPVARTMSHGITRMNHGQGFVANLVTAATVLFASALAVPVSTTHVSCGALFGLGMASGRSERGMITPILLAWVVTLPIAGVISAAVAMVL